MTSRKGDIVRMYEELIKLDIDPNGTDIWHAFAVDHAGDITMVALAMVGERGPEDTMAAMAKLMREGATELIFGLDRYAKPEQGTTLTDVVTVYYFDGRAWRLGIIEYTCRGEKIVKPIDWTNEYWREHQKRDLLHFMGKISIHKNNTPVILPKLQPRPGNLTQEKINQWEKESPILRSPPFIAGWKVDEKELYYAGCWLADMLEPFRLDGLKVHNILLAVGQHTAMNGDPWRNALRSLDQVRQGKPHDEPGEALAEELAREASEYFRVMYGKGFALQAAQPGLN